MSISIQAQGRLKIIIIMQEPRDRFKTTFSSLHDFTFYYDLFC